MLFNKNKLLSAWGKLNFDSYKKQRSIYLASAIIIGGLFFMVGSSVYISSGVSGGSSLEMAIEKRIDDCYKEKGLD